MSRFAGKLHSWNEDRGFGFIRPVDGGQDIFVHVSALPTPRPQPDEVLTFEVGLNRDGKKKAIDVRRQQVEVAALAADIEHRARGRSQIAPRPRSEGKLLRSVIVLVLVAALGWQGYRHYERARLAGMPAMPPAAGQVPEVVQPVAGKVAFQCDGRQHCSQMSSCDEARFFLNNCPGTKMDGDSDGLPCEQGPC